MKVFQVKDGKIVNYLLVPDDFVCDGEMFIPCNGVNGIGDSYCNVEKVFTRYEPVPENTFEYQGITFVKHNNVKQLMMEKVLTLDDEETFEFQGFELTFSDAKNIIKLLSEG